MLKKNTNEWVLVDEQLVDEVVVARLHPAVAFSAAALRAIHRQRRALDVALVRDGDDHLLLLDQVLELDFRLVIDDLGAARLGVFLFDLAQLLDDELHQ